MKYTFRTYLTSFSFVIAVAFSLCLQSCSESADKFFGIAVLNTNMINDFGTPILAKHIDDNTLEFDDIPSSKNKGDEAENDVKNKILYLEKSLNDIKALSDGDEMRKKIKNESIALYEFVIPVYKNEYMAYAKLCDSKAPKEQKDEIIKSIEQKYYADFEAKYESLLSNGKAFAQQNNINVNFN